YLAGRRRPGIAVQQNQSRRRDVEGQPEQGQQEQRGGESSELDRPDDVERYHQHRNRHENVGHDQKVQHQTRQRRDQRQHDPEHPKRPRHFPRDPQRQGPKPWGDGRSGKALRGSHGLRRQPPFHERENVRQNLRHGAIQVRRYLLSDLDRFVQRLRQRRVFDYPHPMLAGLFSGTPRGVGFFFFPHHRGPPWFPVVLY